MKLNAGRGFRPEVSDPKCIGTCLQYESKQKWGESRYADGQKFCLTCHVFMKINKNICPCCKYELRTKPVNPRKK